MKRKALISAVFGLFLLFPACSTAKIHVDAIDGLVTIVSDRHDSLVMGDLDPASLSDLDKGVYLRSTEILRAIIEEASR